MCGGGGDDIDTEPRCEPGQHGIALVVARMAVVRQLDADPILPEPVHQIGKCRRRRFRAAFRQCLPDMAFATPGEDVPVPACGLGQRVEVVAGFALLPAGQMRLGDLARQPAVALRPTGQHQQVRPGRIRILGARDVAQ